MGIGHQLLVIALSFLLAFIYIRAFVGGVRGYLLNKSAYKKRKKGETFKEWLFYSRYTDVLPKALYRFYYAILLMHPVCLLLCIFICVINLSSNIGEIIAVTVACLDVIWMFVIRLLFWSSKKEFPYSRWIKKK